MIAVIILVALLGLYLFGRERVGEGRKTLKIGSTKITVEIADSLPEQIQGLSGKESLCANCGMLFVYPSAKFQTFWMKGMNFPLDIIFIRENNILEIVENLPTRVLGQSIPTITSRFAADRVLEVNAGFVRRHKIKIKEEIEVK